MPGESSTLVGRLVDRELHALKAAEAEARVFGHQLERLQAEMDALDCAVELRALRGLLQTIAQGPQPPPEKDQRRLAERLKALHLRLKGVTQEHMPLVTAELGPFARDLRTFRQSVSGGAAAAPSAGPGTSDGAAGREGK